MSTNPIRVILSGYGKMGHEIERMLNTFSNYQLVTIVDSTNELIHALKHHQADMAIDFSTPESAYPNAKAMIEHRVRPVIGTTGLHTDDIAHLSTYCAAEKLGGIIAPNFSISCVLMQKYAAEMAKYLPHVEIIEYHHDVKHDAPSGTAIKTAEMIASQRSNTPVLPTVHESFAHSRGATVHGIPVHAIRLPGIVANQSIIFGEQGETLTLQHQTISREAFMPGLHLACQKVMHLKKLVYGLEHLLD